MTFNLPALLNILFLVITCEKRVINMVIKLRREYFPHTHRIGVERLCVHLVVVVLAGQVEQDAEGEVQVVRLAQPSLVSQPDQGTLLEYFMCFTFHTHSR